MSLEEKVNGKASENSINIIKDRIKGCSKVCSEDIIHTGMDHYFDLQLVSDKSVADCTESIIGTHLLVRNFRILYS